MTKERRIEVLEEDLCDGYQPRCGCNCERCDIAEFSKVAIERGYVSLQEFIEDLKACLRSLAVEDDDLNEVVWNLAVFKCVNKVEELYKEYIK